MRYKLLFLLVSLPLISLGLYLFIATDLFQKDKVAYVFDSSATVSRSLATQTRMEINSIVENIRTVVENFEPATNEFTTFGKDLFGKNPRLQALILIRRDDAGQYNRIAQISKDLPTAQGFITDSNLVEAARAGAVENGVYLNEHGDDGKLLNMAIRLGTKEEPNHVVVLALYQAEDLLSAFQLSGLYSSFVTTRAGQVAIGSMGVVDADMQLLRPTLNSLAAEGTSEAKLSDGTTYLISFSNVGLGELTVLSRVDKKKALKAVEVLIAKSLLFFVALIASTLLISVFASNQLTSTLRELFEATKKVGQGDFNIRVEAKSNDEIGGLVNSFNWMAAEVARLLTETAEKARMESELSTVKTVQETLFPPAQSQFGPIRISGHYEPASECGGDWWNYSRVGNRIFIWIGDATGHGAPAALITSAARSASAVIEMFPDMNPGRALSIMNRAIHQTSKGQIMMTFFVAAIDLDKNTFTYACASHDPPYLLRKTGEKLSKKDLMPLIDVNGPRLGEVKDHTYEDKVIEFTPGDILFFYTDGILDVENPAGKKWGERVFLKTLIDTTNNNTDVEARVDFIKKEISQFRGGAQLIDDVTMVMCEYEKRAA